MLVTLAVLLLMMVAIVKIFQVATGALNSAQVYQELDNQLRLLDSTIRSDLNGVTCKMTPPNNPKDNKGYFEYGENEFADVQGEDSDDYIRFTAKAPAGQPFTGRMWIRSAYYAVNGTNTNQLVQPITITSEYAEIIYFLRNGNLYRRLLLVSPERQPTIEPTVNNVNPSLNLPNGAGFYPVALGGDPVNYLGNQVSWQAVNDLSAHPAPTGKPFSNKSVILNTLADLTNRENRWAYPRFSSDFEDVNGNLLSYGDGLSDDGSVNAQNGDNVPDYYPTLYPTVLPVAGGGPGPPLNAAVQPNQLIQLIYEPLPTNRPALGAMAFPFVFPGAYSCPQILNNGTAQYGWIHSPNPQVYDLATNSAIAYDTNPLGYLHGINHNPIDTGDNLALPPATPRTFLNGTWWGFPTWRETLSFLWTDPTLQVNYNAAQPFGLTVRAANVVPVNDSINGTLPHGNELLPAMTGTWAAAPSVILRVNPQPFTDGYGDNTGFFTAASTLWSQYSWEDDLVMTGVRSFDIKAYDNSYAGYVDLGWGDDPRVTGLLNPQYLGVTNPPIPYLPCLAGNYDPLNGYTTTAYAYVNNGKYDLLNQTFAHEGRMPPLYNDYRLDAQYGAAALYLPPTSPYLPVNGGTYSGNIGDDNPQVVRLRRVWDSWSTEYTQAPGTGVNPPGPVGTPNPAANFPAGPPYTPPIYPSYPPPYPAPLRGIQIQIRVTDPTNQRVKTLTIRQDFTDKL